MAEPTHPDVPPSGNRAAMVVLSYLWILALVPLIVAGEDREIQWHARNGIALMAAEFLFWIAFNIVFGVTMGIGCLGFLIGPLFGLLFISLHVVAMMRGLKGRRLTVPLLSEAANRF